MVPPSDQNPLSVADPASQPYVLAVGGTTIQNAGQPAAETAWNDGAEWGGTGGGISQSWAMPSWQQNSPVPGIVGPSSADYTNANGVETQFGWPTGFCQGTIEGATPTTPCRLVPDVSSDADEFTGAVTIYYLGGWTTIGGTSSSSPIWAAMLALVNSSASCSLRRRDEHRLRPTAAVRGRVEPDRVRRLVQRHHVREQRHLRLR